MEGLKDKQLPIFFDTPTVADGNCLYHALCQQLGSTPRMRDYVRELHPEEWGKCSSFHYTSLKVLQKSFRSPVEVLQSKNF